jgi:hypothetical protein
MRCDGTQGAEISNGRYWVEPVRLGTHESVQEVIQWRTRNISLILPPR